MTISTQDYKIADNISITELDGELVLLNLNDGAYYGINNIGAKLVDAIQNQQNLENEINNIVERFQIERATVNADLDSLLLQLIEQKLVLKIND